MFGASVIFLFASLAFVAPLDRSYNLEIYEEQATRKETVQEISPGELQVKGHQDIFYPTYDRLFVSYEAGRNGYVASYVFQGANNRNIQYLPPVLLKLIVG
ncbi:uncharacterized protein LOC135437808 [Drosophila montana]|uniref:uncharacterized protein LOC135437808 n=1 Tax=Drosophila montana TaxID=40370 RepID=UPI00313BC297